jgi:hypothetical protein
MPVHLPPQGAWAATVISNWCCPGRRVDDSTPSLLALAAQGDKKSQEPSLCHMPLVGLVCSLVKLTSCPGFTAGCTALGSSKGLSLGAPQVCRHNVALACCAVLQMSAGYTGVARAAGVELAAAVAAGVLRRAEEEGWADACEQKIPQFLADCAVAAVGPASSPTSFPGLPWLVLLGRVCSQSADALTGFDPVKLTQQQQQQQQQQQPGEVVLDWADPAGVLLQVWGSKLSMAGPLNGVSAWLEVNREGLAAAGYSVQGVAEQLGLLQQRWGTACGIIDWNTSAKKEEFTATATAAAAGLVNALVGELAESLRAFGAAVSSALPVPHFCNNPGCRNVSGDSEVALVSGRSCICAGCKVARYCGRSCQRACWKVHKPVCQALADASTAAAAAAAAETPDSLHECREHLQSAVAAAVRRIQADAVASG